MSQGQATIHTSISRDDDSRGSLLSSRLETRAEQAVFVVGASVRTESCRARPFDHSSVNPNNAQAPAPVNFNGTALLPPALALHKSKSQNLVKIKLTSRLVPPHLRHAVAGVLFLPSTPPTNDLHKYCDSPVMRATGNGRFAVPEGLETGVFLRSYVNKVVLSHLHTL